MSFWVFMTLIVFCTMYLVQSVRLVWVDGVIAGRVFVICCEIPKSLRAQTFVHNVFEDISDLFFCVPLPSFVFLLF